MYSFQQIRENWQDFRLHIEDTPEFSKAYRAQLRKALMEANKTIGYAVLSKLSDRLWARQIAKELRAETALDDEITSLLTAQAEKLATQADAMAVVPTNFSNGS